MSKRPHIRAVGGDTSAPALSVDTAERDTAERADEVLVVGEEYVADEGWYDEPAPHRQHEWLLPTFGVLAIVGWSGFFAWATGLDAMGSGTAEQWIGWITSWATPVLLVVALWLLAMRSSTREAQRFGNVAQRLGAESAMLEERLAIVNRELSLAREFLTTQTRELEFLGRTATERLSTNADRLQALVHDNGAQLESIVTVSTNALDNMNKLRDSLPVITNSARDVTNQIGGAGRTAQGQLNELISGFERLNEFGAASERQILSLRKRVDDALSAYVLQTDHLETLADQRFVALREDSEKFRGELDSREVEALASIRGRADALRIELAESHASIRSSHDTALSAMQDRLATLRDEAAAFAMGVRDGETAALGAWGGQIDAMQNRLREAVDQIGAVDQRALDSAQKKLSSLLEEAEAVDTRLADRDRMYQSEVDRRRNDLDVAEAVAFKRLDERLSALDAAIAERREAQVAQLNLLADQGVALGAQVNALGEQFATIAGQGDEARGTLANGIDALNAKLIEGREALDGTDMAVAALTDASVRLLELIQASAKQSRDDLPTAMAASEARLAEIEQRADQIRALLDQARQSGEAVTTSMEAADTRSRETIAQIDSFQTRFGEASTVQANGIEQLRANIAALDEEGQTVSQRVQSELRAAIEKLETNAREALAFIENDQTDRIARMADQLGEKSAAAIDRAVQEHGEQAMAKLDEATQRSSEASRDAARQLRDQLAKVNELTANLETRVLRARERAEQQVDSDFSRRVALITESLNSNAIDIAKAMSTDVTDTAWASYLRGDRGIFTRRAVRLLDTTEAREIAELYSSDADFHEHVNRYIHDFESMLRVMLSTRDGNAVSVTLLSSDMGKLYVALAQAIERLRQ